MSATLVVVTITATVERDYERRGVFPELRVAKAAETMYGGTAGVFEISPERAQEVLADAERERLVRASPKGTPKAYSALVRQLRREEREDERERACRRRADLEELTKAAALDAKVKQEQERLSEQPATEEEFRAIAHAYFWRAWQGFVLVFCRPDGHQFKASGYRFTAAAQEILGGYVHSIVWALEEGVDVVFDEDVRFAALDRLRREATKADAPLQRFIGALTGSSSSNG